MTTEQKRGLVLSLDVPEDDLGDLMRQVAGTEGLTGVKLGFSLGLELSLYDAVDTVREADSTLEVIYDHQKGGTDIPKSGADFARIMENAEVDSAIIFPFTGPTTQERWTKELQDHGIRVICGAEMTHDDITASYDGRQGGYIHPEAYERIFSLAVDLGVTDFVVPGNKPDRVSHYREAIFDRRLGEGNYTLWAPGFLTQGGDLTETGRVAGPNFRAIVGSGIYNAENPGATARQLGQQLLALGS